MILKVLILCLCFRITVGQTFAAPSRSDGTPRLCSGTMWFISWAALSSSPSNGWTAIMWWRTAGTPNSDPEPAGQSGRLRLQREDLHLRRVRSGWVCAERPVGLERTEKPVMLDWWIVVDRKFSSESVRVLRHAYRDVADEAQHADAALQSRISGGQRPHLRLRRKSGKQRVRQSPQRLRGVRPQHWRVRLCPKHTAINCFS